ncbi:MULTISPECIES: PACE efflux transporter [unclassified Acinetobacter]|uniref:PACE efflux transporter n=1 Tax=unclassified Acinetobacter TaxID=196816 RepID=UPI0035B794C7
MSIYERIFHAILFEVLAVILSIIGLSIFTQHNTSALASIVILISLLAMLWNMIFNWIFDRFFTARRETRGIKIRLIHVLCFEGGLLLMTLPLVAYILNISLWQAFILDLAMTLFIMIYTLIFNWAYDHLRLKFIKN